MQPETNFQRRIEAFKASITADLQSVHDFVNMEKVKATAGKYRSELSALDQFGSGSGQNGIRSFANLLLGYESLYEVVCRLLAINGPVEFEDERRLLAPKKPIDPEGALEIATIMDDMGLLQLFAEGEDWATAFEIAGIGADAPRRRFRAMRRLEAKVEQLVLSALETARKVVNMDLSLVASTALPGSGRRVADFSVAVDGRAKIAIASTFQTQSGGRQQRDLEVIYPRIQSEMAAEGISLILIADGQGMREVSDRVLMELFRHVSACLTLRQAESGELASEIARLVQQTAQVEFDPLAIDRLIASTLARNLFISLRDLPIPPDQARLALARYTARNSEFALALAAGGESLSWERSAAVARANSLSMNFSPPDAIGLIADLLQGDVDIGNSVCASEALTANVVQLPPDPILSTALVVAASTEAASTGLLREVSRCAMQAAHDARVTALITGLPLAGGQSSDIRRLQSHLPVALIILDVFTLANIAKSTIRPRDALVSMLLEQSDLTKVSPFVVRGATPERVFFGREEEEATLLSTLTTNSVALLGGRRIGKTSLMHHALRGLEEADFRPLFGDCQTVRTWSDFGALAHRNWNVALPEDFKPQHLYELVRATGDKSGRMTVFLLDEIDQLLDWDRSHSPDEVPEAFFRACRSISQERLAQFVFSGERVIASRIWDAQSPHWNFCRPLPLQQLTRSAAAALISEPLKALGVPVVNVESFVQQCWLCTDGHPELLQFLGDRLIGLLNMRSRKALRLTVDDVGVVTNQYEYAEQYLETYWGQGTRLERLISLLLVLQGGTPAYIEEQLSRHGIVTKGDEVVEALRMLELYGIVRQSESGYELRAKWFPTALSFYGGVQGTTQRFLAEAA
jgi:hypothetical protein